MLPPDLLNLLSLRDALARGRISARVDSGDARRPIRGLTFSTVLHADTPLLMTAPRAPVDPPFAGHPRHVRGGGTPSSTQIVTGSRDGTARIWRCLEALHHALAALTFDRDTEKRRRD